MAVVDFFPERYAELDPEALDEILSLLPVIDDGMNHPDPRHIRVYIESYDKGKPVPFPVAVLSFHLDDGQHGPVFLYGDIFQVALEVVKVYDSSAFLTDVFRNANQLSIPCDFCAPHLNRVNQPGPFFGEADCFRPVFDENLIVFLLNLDIPGHRRRVGFHASLLLGKGLHGDFKSKGVFRSYRTRQAQPFDRTIPMSGHHPLLQRQHLPGPVG